MRLSAAQGLKGKSGFFEVSLHDVIDVLPAIDQGQHALIAMRMQVTQHNI